MTTTRVLVIDDNAVTRSLIADVLSDEPVHLMEASSGFEGLERAREDSPDIVLLDVVLPDVSGFVVAEHLRESRTTPLSILALAGLLDQADEQRLAQGKFDDVVTKPIDPARLREAIRLQLQQAPPDRRRFGEHRSLLLVEDDPLQRKLATIRLTRLGFDVTCAENAERALALLRGLDPDVVVSDVLMPQIDGFELCTRLRADPRFAATQIILVTNNYLDASDHELARRVGADAYVHREPDLRGLVEALRAAFSPLPTTRERISVPELQRERDARTARQLDKQLALNVSLAQQTAILSAEIAILDGLARALADNRDPDSAIDAALLACFDAARFEWGVMLTVEPDGEWRHRSVGLRDASLRESLQTMADRLARGPEAKATYQRTVAELFGLRTAGHVLVAPMRYREQTIGAMVLGATAAPTDDQRAFATVVASQLALVLALSRTFSALQRATHNERERVHVLESILDTIREPIVVVDQDARPTHWNRAARSTPPSDSSRPQGSSCGALRLFHPDMSTPLREHEQPVRRALRGEEVVDCEVFATSDESEPRWFSVAARPVRDDEDLVTGAVVVTRDVTEAKRAHAQQITSDRLASVGVLAAGVAHEINNPLTSIIAELDMALEDLEPQHPVRDRLRVASDAATRVRTILGDLKTLSHGEGTPSDNVDIRRVLEVALRIAAPEWRRAAQVDFELPPLPGVIGNEPRLVQVFVNLIVNAAQAISPTSEREQRISIRGGMTDESEVFVEVTDTGCGMSAEVKARIFTPFFTTKPVGTGTGLGLSISQRIVSDAGGRIECESVAGRGTTFRVRLRAVTQGSGATDALPSPGDRSIVLIEGDPLTRQLVVKALATSGSLEVVEHVDRVVDRRSRSGRALLLCSSADAQIAGPASVELAVARGYALGLLGGAAPTWLQAFPSLRKPFDAKSVQQFAQTLFAQMSSEGNNE
ncbi:MAG: response regulator [Myxococcales bacterium]|nr:response regulator [Myxococcales bacterium]